MEEPGRLEAGEEAGGLGGSEARRLEQCH